MFTLTKEKELVWTQILYLFIIPTLLLYFKIIPREFRLLLLFSVSLFLYGIVRHSKWTWSNLGVSKKFMKDIVPYTVFTLAGVGFLFWLSAIVPHSPFLNWWKNLKFLIFFIPVSIFQELAFRGILMRMLRQVFTNPAFIIIMNATIFSLIHIIYINATFVLPLTFIAGIGFAWIYYKYPNLILISISHTALNFVGMVLGFFIVR